MAATVAARAHRDRARPAAPSPQAAPAGPPTLGPLVLLLRFSTVMTGLLAVASLPGSSVFAVREIAVVGARETPAAAILARAGLRPGDRLFAVPPSRIERRVATLPRVARAHVRLGITGRVTIEVEERPAYAAVPFRRQYLVVDPQGVVIDAQPAAGGLPLVTSEGFAPPWVRLGDRLPDAGVGTALAALGELPPGVVTPGTLVRADARGELVLATPDGITVRLGPPRGLRERASLLGELLAAVRARGLAVESLDLRFSGTVVMKPAGAGAAGERP